MAKKRDGQFRKSLVQNSAVYRQYYNRLTELAISMFEWKNLPESVDPRYLELTLFSNGAVVFFYDDVLGYLALQCALGGDHDVYRIPNNRRAYSANGYNRQLDAEDSVIIFNNYLHTNSMLDVEVFSERLYNLDRAIDVNANAQKTPILIKCDEAQRLTLTNLYKQYDGNEPAIFADKNLNPDAFGVVQTHSPYVADKLYDLKTRIWNEALTYLGISNISFQKKERMISDEVIRAQGGTIASRYSRLQARREAAEKINKMFNLNIEVSYREDFRELDDEVMIQHETEDRGNIPVTVDLRTRYKGDVDERYKGGDNNE